MVDLAATLKQYQKALALELIEPEKCDSCPNLYVLQDDAGEKPRITYARIIDNEVQGLVSFVLVDPYEGKPCFHVGYAIDPNYQNRGIGSKLLNQSLQELQKGLIKYIDGSYFIEAVVNANNEPSKRLAARHISDQPILIVCQSSGENALQYLKRFPKKE